jgi:hypothetical protein
VQQRKIFSLKKSRARIARELPSSASNENRASAAKQRIRSPIHININLFMLAAANEFSLQNTIDNQVQNSGCSGCLAGQYKVIII